MVIFDPKTASVSSARLLDADTNGLVDLEEFVTGCLNLHGTAKSPLGPDRLGGLVDSS